jgi:hypothetical protein
MLAFGARGRKFKSQFRQLRFVFLKQINSIEKLARRSKFKANQNRIRAGVEFRVCSKVEIQNLKKAEFRKGVEFRTSSKIEIIFLNLNFELELNFEPARRSKF